MINAKHHNKSARMRQMREDLSIVMGVQRIRRPPVRRNNSFAKRPTNWPNCSSQTIVRNPIATPSPSSSRPPLTPMNLNFNWPTPGCSTSETFVRKAPTPTPSSSFRSVATTGFSGFGQVEPKPASNFEVFRKPMPYMFKSVQPPVQEPATPFKEANKLIENDNEFVLQSPWVTRSAIGLSTTANNTTTSEAPYQSIAKITKNMSIKQIIDALCGEGPEVPELTKVFPFSSNKNNNRNNIKKFKLF